VRPGREALRSLSQTITQLKAEGPLSAVTLIVSNYVVERYFAGTDQIMTDHSELAVASCV
jgi:hypothetical protein